MAERPRRDAQPNVRQTSLTDLSTQPAPSGEPPAAAPAAAKSAMLKRKKGNTPVTEKPSGNEEDREEEGPQQDQLDEGAEPRPETATKEGELETVPEPAKKKGRTSKPKQPFL